LLLAAASAQSAQACPGAQAASAGKPAQCARLKAGLPCNCAAKQPGAAASAGAAKPAPAPAKAGAPATPPATATAAASATAEVPMAFDKRPASGTKARCPVTGETFAVNDKSETSTYKRKVYVFCCPGCKPPFDKNPAQYAKR
jgi:YHS domain-containing protein